MGQPLQVMLEDSVHDVDVVEYPHEDDAVLGVELVDASGRHLMQAAVGPLLVANEIPIRSL